MPLDLPPPLPPQQADAAVLEERHAVASSQGDVIQIGVGQYTLRISGNTYLSEGRIREVVEVGKTPSQVILLLNALYAAEGYLFVNVEYARRGNSDTIYVQVNEGHLADVEAPPELAPYFEKFEGERGVRKRDLEPMRVLAQIKADRMGRDVSSEYRIDDSNPEAFTLRLEGEEKPAHDPVTFTTVFGNPGNRFLGRYFGFANAKIDTPGGDQIGVGYGTAFTGLGDTRNGESYDNYSLSYSTVTTLGLYSLSASHTEYEVEERFDLDDREEAEIFRLKASGSQFLYADEKTRWVLEQELQYTYSIIEFVSADPPDLIGQRAQDEEYGAFRLGTTVSRSWELFDRRGSVSGGAGYKRGLGGNVENLVNTGRRTDFNILDAKMTLRYLFPWELVGSLDLKGQKSIERLVPQDEQWVLGGTDNLSAYLPGILIGDSGAYARLQLQLPRWKLFDRPYRFSLFTEAGTAKFENGPEQSSRSACDAGVKLEAAPADWLELKLYAAEGFCESNLDSDFVERNEADLFFNVKAEF